MAAFDLEQKTIKHKGWAKGEEVIIREITYGESAQLTSAAMSEVNMVDMEDEEKRKALKMDLLDMSKSQVGMMKACIVSWTFKLNGKVAPITYDNISKLSESYGDYIMEEINKFGYTPDEEFPGKPGTGAQEQGEATTGDVAD